MSRNTVIRAVGEVEAGSTVGQGELPGGVVES